MKTVCSVYICAALDRATRALFALAMCSDFCMESCLIVAAYEIQVK